MGNKKTRVLIVGGGFGGVKAALELADCDDCEVTLLSDHSHFRYYPALYLAATGGKRAGSRIRLSNMLADTRIRFVRGKAATLDRAKKTIETDDHQTLGYDKLIMAVGNVTNYFGIKGLDTYSYGIKSSEEADAFKKHLHEQFVKNACPDLNYIIVGGGPTGIELAGALPSYLKHVMQKHGVKDCKLHIELVEAAPRLLPRSPKSISRAVAKRLKKLGVKVMLGQTVSGQTADMLMVNDKPLPSHTVIWTAGVTNHPFFKANDFKITERGKVEVNELLEAEPDIYVLGDNANTPYSGMAQTALFDGAFVAANIQRKITNKPQLTYVPKKPISVIPVGPYWASVEWGKATYTGWVGWLLRTAADFVAFNNLETWTKAGAQWLATMGEEDDDCPNCVKNKK